MGAGLPAMAECQSYRYWLIYHYRRQASSHISFMEWLLAMQDILASKDNGTLCTAFIRNPRL